MGSVVDKVQDYFSYITTYTSDQASLESILSAQSLVRLENNLPSVYQSFKDGISQNIDRLIGRTTDVLTDETLMGANFPFGTTASLDLVFPALIHDMAISDKNVVANTASVGSATYTAQNSTVGKVLIGTVLDGVTPPLEGGPAIRDYSGVTTQLTPTSETVTLTCSSDSESTGSIRGSEQFVITGTNAASSGYSSGGENVGQLGTITAIDNAATPVTDGSFEGWTSSTVLSSWTDESTSPCIEQSSNTVYGTGYSLKVLQNDAEMSLSQVVPNSALQRRKSYFISAWAAKDTDVANDPLFTISIGDDNGTFSGVGLDLTPTGTAWEHFYLQIIPPDEIVGDIVISLSSFADSSADSILVDNITIVPCEYFSGVALAVTTGPDKFLLNDKISFTLSNNDTGKFQTYFRKAYKVQLPTDATPTISDALVT